MMITEITVADFQKLITDGLVWHGDCVCIYNGEHGMLNAAIAYVHKRLLVDLYGKDTISKEDLDFYSTFTHTMRVVDENRLGENYYPHARTQLWKDYLVGKTIQVTRPNFMTVEEGEKMAQLALEEEVNKVPYPWWKLFQYYGYRWGWQKTFLGKPLMKIFDLGKSKDKVEYQVCSGIYWQDYVKTIADKPKYLHGNDIMPEVWYPARIAYDSYYFSKVGTYKIIR